MLFIKLTPKTSKDALVRVEQDGDGKARLKVTVTAIPEKGKANTALIKLLSKKLGLPKTSIELIAGDQSRLKTILLNGETAALEKILSERVAALG
tara:strand:- start:621 stop:905 length:285 start_codon:yes stop_codon:yes gene_type:complete